MKTTAIILAAGQGTRMKSALPKMLHSLCGQPMLAYALAAARSASNTDPVVVVGHGADQVREAIGGAARFVVQEKQLGTGHAVRQAEAVLRAESDLILVTYGDMPLLGGEILRKLVEQQRTNPGPITLLTVVADDPRGFGRIVRNRDGTVAAIVEEAAATPEQLTIRELNVGAYCFRADWLWEALHRIPASAKGEYYLTDTVALAVAAGLSVQALTHEEIAETIGINTRVDLADAEAALRRRINRGFMLAGVSIVDPATTYIDAMVSIGPDTVIFPNTHLQGGTSIGANCLIGPNSFIRDTQIGGGCKVLASVLEGAVVEDGVGMGPYTHLRKGAHLGKGVHMGNFGEVKDSYLGPGVKMGHFSYVGNARIGANTNIGAGTITCNYDGVKKHPTEIGEDAFIGSDTMLVAPVKIGDRARTGAGAVVTKDVPADTLAVGMPARAIRKLERRKTET
jgi:bifunctional UDP-N-acetylglucosamine pyrophosphorylase / glucosamine-1-phosphate N-acetyltransferase